jgi:hypothetical protein
MAETELSQEGRHLILSLARPTAYVPLARAILGRMGYAIVPLDDWRSHPPLAEREPRLGLVDDRLLDELPSAPPFDRLPLVLLTGRDGVTTRDRRVIGGVSQPAGLHELYRLLQQVIEPIPRGALRIATDLPVRVRLGDKEASGSLLSLSENGGLLRTLAPMRLGARLDLSFELPCGQRIETAAEASYQLIPDFGLVFQSTPAAVRSAIRSFVEEHLAAA